jgi:YVTN family beta-propeller protein
MRRHWRRQRHGLRNFLKAVIAYGSTVVISLILLNGSFPNTTASSETLTDRPLPSKPLVLTTDGQTLVVANPESHTLSLLNTETLTVTAEIPVGRLPRSVAVSSEGRAYVANQGSDDISVVDLKAQKVIHTIPVGDRPSGIVLSPDERFLALSENGDDTVRYLDAQTLVTTLVIRVEDRPYGLSFTPDGRSLLVSHLYSGRVTRIAFWPYTQYLPLINPSNSGRGEQGQGSVEFDTQITISTWPNVAPAPSVVVNGDGSRAYLPQTMAHGLGLNTQFDTTVFPKVSVIDLVNNTHEKSEHISLPETDRPVGLPWDAALSPDEGELWVVNSASNDTSVIDIRQPTRPRRAGHIAVGDNPRGIVLSPDGKKAYVNNTLAGTVTVIDTAALTVTQTVEVAQIPLPPLLLEGKRLFYSSARSDLAQAAWISCNSCHVEGEHDGRTWQLQFLGQVPPGEKPVIVRNTTSLLGMVQTYPLRWSAEWDESADSEFSVRFEQFGTGLIQDGQMHPTLGAPNQGRSAGLDALAAFIDSLVAPERGHIFNETELRGRALFESQGTGCINCHPPPVYTDLKVHDVGTAGGPGEWFGPLIDTPTLRFLYDSPPYLHDGSAASLLELLTTSNGDDLHGKTSHLSENELADLISYLLALPE